MTNRQKDKKTNRQNPISRVDKQILKSPFRKYPLTRKYVVVDDGGDEGVVGDGNVDDGADGDGADDGDGAGGNGDNSHLLLSTRSIHCPGDILGRNGL